MGSAGRSTLTGLRPSAGSHGITAAYSGDRTHGPSGATMTVTMRAASRTSVSAIPDPAGIDDRVTPLAAVASTAPGPPTGTVTFTLGGTVAASPPLLDGHAALEVVPAGAGPHPVACYSGDAAVAPSSAAATVTVERAATTIEITAVAQPAEPTAGG